MDRFTAVASERNQHCGGEVRPEGLSRGRVLGEGAVSPSPPVRGSGRALRNAGRQEFWCILAVTLVLGLGPGLKDSLRTGYRSLVLALALLLSP